MCIPKKSKRKSQTTLVTSQKKPEARKICSTAQDKSPPVLVKLEVQGALPLLAKPGTFWEATHATETIIVTAITEPNTAEAWDELEWNVETDIPNQVKGSRSEVGEGRIGARMPGTPWQYVDVEIYDLDSVVCDLPNKLKDRDLHWKSFTSDTPAKVSISLGQTKPKVLIADLHICQWPEFEI